MRPFKLFFGLSLAFVVFFFLLRFVVIAFIAAGVLSLIYAVFRRLKDFVTYDRFGQPYFDRYQDHPRFQRYNQEDFVEPLFYNAPAYRTSMPTGNVQFVKIK